MTENGFIPPTKYKIVRSEDLPKRSRPHRVHGARLQVNQNGAGYIFTSSARKRMRDEERERREGEKTYQLNNAENHSLGV